MSDYVYNTTYTVGNFKGIDESTSENQLNVGYTPYCFNMDTEKGDLMVGYGYSKHITTPVPGTGTIHRMYHWHTLQRDMFVVCAGDYLYAWSGTQWVKIFDYESTRTYPDFGSATTTGVDLATNTRWYELTPPSGWSYSDGCLIKFTSTGSGEQEHCNVIIGDTTFALDTYREWASGTTVKLRLTEGACTEGIAVASDVWDFEECKFPDRSGVSKDWLVIANGETQMVKWDGTLTADSAVLFGSGLYVHETTIESVTWNGTKATAATYVEDSTSATGTFTLTMPSGWSYTQNCLVAFTPPQSMGTLTTCKISINSTEYTLDYVPTWPSGEQAVVQLTDINKGTEYLEDFGITAVSLTDAIPTEWVVRCKNVGITLDEVSYAVSEVGSDRKTLTLEEINDVELEAGDTATLRGEASEAAVNYIELYYSRMFTAGDPDAPSRLYWSQPPGDEKSIEDWSMDEAAADTSGGYVEVGQTSSDPIVGLCALSNQLLIFKKSSLYRMIGSTPSTYKIVLVNKDIETMVNTGRIAYGDTPYWLTRAGLYYHTGSTSQLMANARNVMDTLDKADISRCKAASCRDRLYFSMRLGTGSTDDSILIYDKVARTYLLRNGFECIDLASYDGKLYMINSNRYVYVWDKSTTYDGTAINAEWDTPLTDMGEMTVIKTLDGMYFRGEGGIVNIKYYIGDFETTEAYQMPEATGEIVSVPLRNEGRVFKMIITNDNGSWFRMLGNIGIHYERKVARL